MPKVSIIVPVYNVDKFLEQCIESVLFQTFNEWELILVDDGSSDESGKICDNYAAIDNRIRVIHKENAGVSVARNCGLDLARGEFIGFLDSDDMLTKDALELQYRAMVQNNVDCVISGLTFFYEDKSCEKTFFTSRGKMLFQDDLNEWYNDFDKNYVFGSLYSKLYRKSIINKEGIRFKNNYCILEDGMFVMEYLSCCGAVFCLDHSLYIYRQFDAPSLMKKFNSNAIDALVEYYQKYKVVLAFLDEHNKQRVYEIFGNYYMGFMCQIYTRSNLCNRAKYRTLKVYCKKFCGMHIMQDLKPKSKQYIILKLANMKMTWILHWLLLIGFKIKKV